MTERLASWASTEGVARAMPSNRRRDTAPELALRSILHARGLRYRVDFVPLATMRQRRADIVFTKARIAVFVDGCFWHGCPEHATFPVRNADYWLPKLERNRRRDAETDAVLIDAGWRVIRIWEHDDPAEAADRIEGAYRSSP